MLRNAAEDNVCKIDAIQGKELHSSIDRKRWSARYLRNLSRVSALPTDIDNSGWEAFNASVQTVDSIARSLAQSIPYCLSDDTRALGTVQAVWPLFLAMQHFESSGASCERDWCREVLPAFRLRGLSLGKRPATPSHDLELPTGDTCLTGSSKPDSTTTTSEQGNENLRLTRSKTPEEPVISCIQAALTSRAASKAVYG